MFSCISLDYSLAPLHGLAMMLYPFLRHTIEVDVVEDGGNLGEDVAIPWERCK
jgi:hypothetical protein